MVLEIAWKPSWYGHKKARNEMEAFICAMDESSCTYRFAHSPTGSEQVSFCTAIKGWHWAPHDDEHFTCRLEYERWDLESGLTSRGLQVDNEKVADDTRL